MDVGALSRVLKHFGLWRPIEERVKQLPETASQIGHALTYEEQHKLLEVASGNPDWEPVYLAAVLAANTSLRPVEVKHLQWRNVDLIEGLIRVTRSKNQSSHRVTPQPIGKNGSSDDEVTGRDHWLYPSRALCLVCKAVATFRANSPSEEMGYCVA